MLLEVTCRVCQREHEPTPDDIRRGRWRVCPDCRPRPKDPRPLRVDDAPLGHRSEGMNNGH